MASREKAETYEEALIVGPDVVRPAGKEGTCFCCTAVLGAEHFIPCILHPDSTYFTCVDWVDTLTGKTGTYDEWEEKTTGSLYKEEDGSPHLWMWTEGNYSCDCNRGIFFLDRDFGETDCGDGRFVITRMRARKWGGELFDVGYDELPEAN